MLPTQQCCYWSASPSKTPSPCWLCQMHTCTQTHILSMVYISWHPAYVTYAKEYNLAVCHIHSPVILTWCHDQRCTVETWAQTSGRTLLPMNTGREQLGFDIFWRKYCVCCKTLAVKQCKGHYRVFTVPSTGQLCTKYKPPAKKKHRLFFIKSSYIEHYSDDILCRSTQKCISPRFPWQKVQSDFSIGFWVFEE